MELHTWNLYKFVNQCLPIKSIKGGKEMGILNDIEKKFKSLGVEEDWKTQLPLAI